MSVQAVTVDENGISIKSFNEIRSALEADFKSVFSDLNTDPSSPDGMIIDLVSYAIMELAQNIQAIYSNLNLTTSHGAFLSSIAYMAGIPRNEGEDDDNLRMRVATATHSGLATFDSMVTYLRSKGLQAIVVENTNSINSNGMTPHSISVSVPADYSAPEGYSGTKENYVANCIWACKPVGIRTNGNVSGTATDESGNSHTVLFNLSRQIPYSLKVVIKSYREEILPDDYEELIKKSVVEWAGEKMVSGKDIIPQRFCAPIYDNVDGIENVTIYVKKATETQWTTDIVPINPEVVATFSEENIQVLVE